VVQYSNRKGGIMSRLPIVFGLVILGLALVVAGGATQEKGKDKDDKGKVKGTLPQGFKDLGLSKDQITKIYTIQGDYKKKISELDAKIKEYKSQQFQDELKVLTDEQREKYLKSKGLDTKGKDDKGKTDK
jgi:hypothetical protein